MRMLVGVVGVIAISGCFGFEDRPADNFFFGPILQQTFRR